MSSYYWIKFYHEVLDDPKMGRLSDNLWRRFFECCLMAGELNKDGRLPRIADIAWRLRIEEEALRAEFDQLSRIGLLDFIATDPLDEHWIVSNFSKRQAAIPAAERMKMMRDTRKKRKYYDTSDENVTKRNTDIDIDKDKEVEADLFPPTPSPTFSQESIQERQARKLLESVCGVLASNVNGHFEIVENLIAEYGYEATASALREARSRWIKTPRKDGRGYYSPTNYGFIDWAVAALSGNAPWCEVKQLSPVEKILADLERQAENG